MLTDVGEREQLVPFRPRTAHEDLDHELCRKLVCCSVGIENRTQGKDEGRVSVEVGTGTSRGRKLLPAVSSVLLELKHISEHLTNLSSLKVNLLCMIEDVQGL